MEHVADKEIIDDKPQVINADLRKFNKSEQMVKTAIAALNAITVIENKEQSDNALVVLKEAKTVEKKLEDKRKELVTPFNTAVKKINDFAKTLVEKLPVAIDDTKKKVLAFQQAEEERVKKENYNRRVDALKEVGFEYNIENNQWVILETITIDDGFIKYADAESWNPFISDKIYYINEKRRRLQNEQQASAEDDAMFGTEDQSPLADEGMQPETIEFNSAPPVTEVSKVKGITKRWVFEITNMKQLPIEYLQVNEVALRAAIAKGERLIPGVRIYQQDGLTIR